MLRALGVSGILLFLALTAAEHVIRPELSPATHQISEYANGRDGALMTAAFLLWSISLACTGSLAWRVGLGRSAGVALFVAAAGIAMTAAWPTQTSAGVLRPGETLGAAGRLHDIGSGIATFALLLAAIMSLRFCEAGLRRFTAVILAAAIPADIVLLAIGSDVAGIRQRVLVLAACLWQLAILVGGLRSEPRANRWRRELR